LLASSAFSSEQVRPSAVVACRIFDVELNRSQTHTMRIFVFRTCDLVLSPRVLSLITNRLLSDVSILVGSGRQVISLIRTKNRPPSCPGLPRASTCSLPEQERRGWP
jgi:hypothetical protein